MAAQLLVCLCIETCMFLSCGKHYIWYARKVFSYWHVLRLFIEGSRIFKVLIYFTEKYSIIAAKNNPSADIIRVCHKSLRRCVLRCDMCDAENDECRELDHNRYGAQGLCGRGALSQGLPGGADSWRLSLQEQRVSGHCFHPCFTRRHSFFTPSRGGASCQSNLRKLTQLRWSPRSWRSCSREASCKNCLQRSWMQLEVAPAAGAGRVAMNIGADNTGEKIQNYMLQGEPQHLQTPGEKQKFINASILWKCHISTK